MVAELVAEGQRRAGGDALPLLSFVLAELWADRDPERRVLPAATLLGAILVLLVDTAGRSLAAPLQLPVGALTALVGVPVFLWQLQRS